MPTLITTTAELKEILGVQINKNYSESSFIPSVSQCEQEYIIDLLGQEQYDDLIANIASPSAPQLALINQVKKPLSWFVYHELLRNGQIQLGDAGIKETSNEQTQNVRQWVLDDALKSAYQKADRFSDFLLAFLEKNKTDYPLWLASDAATIYKTSFITNTDDFEKHQRISKSRRLFKIVAQEFEIVDIRYIIPTLSQDLYDEVKRQIATDTLTAENKVLIGYIKKVIAPFALKQAIPEININVEVGGLKFYKENTGIKSSEQASNEAIDFFIKKLDEKGQDYVRQLKKFLQNNLDTYPLYRDSTCNKTKTKCEKDVNRFRNGTFVV
jgi:hypothetical protein